LHFLRINLAGQGDHPAESPCLSFSAVIPGTFFFHRDLPFALNGKAIACDRNIQVLTGCCPNRVYKSIKHFHHSISWVIGTNIVPGFVFGCEKTGH